MSFLSVIYENVTDWAPRMIAGLQLTLILTAGGFSLALLMALALEYLRSRQNAAVRLLGRIYLALARGIPILVILYLLYFALPAAGLTLPAKLAGIIGLGCVYAAYIAEVLRAGFNALPAGQREAALASGLTPLQTFWLVLLPQAIRHMLAPLLINLTSLMKDSSICALIAVPELTLASREIMSESFLPLPVFMLTALLYFFMAWPASVIARVIDHRLRSYPPRSVSKMPDVKHAMALS
ncbi:ABC transporter permease [Rhizobium sp. Root73]|uniref:amino acid ABC transporter permease n=1 Tax=unclassified Rhizobium TaxID=2613769 RepID=UPI0007290EB9|nr:MULTISPECIES: amino acid ABC transporter permease [unclassified Rhizobium]KQY15060.1 ABC transporter permease [Rhizobium sp. Root1334]KRC06492.1 ABC transporter permease [Rhizobium sp. Root73]